MQPHLDKKSKINEPRDLIKFGWEKEQGAKVVDMNITDEQKAMFDKIDNLEFNKGGEDVFDELFNEVAKKQQLQQKR